MRIAGVQKLTLLDFPGHIAATVFTPGCNLRCPFCHNSELAKDEIDMEYKIEAFFAFLEGRRGKLSGVAITGGEPLMQQGIEDFIKRITDMGFEIKLDTNGCYPDKLKRILESGLVKYVAMDIKNSPESWNKTAGVSEEAGKAFFANTLRSMDIIRNSGVDYEFRTTVVKELHSVSDMDGIGSLLKPEDKYFLQCFKDSGAIMEDGFSAHDKETMLKLLETAKKYAPKAELRGID